MLINTAVFGPIDVEENSLYDLPDGLLGFEEAQRYALITKQDDGATLRWFQSVDDTMPCFVVFNPLEIVDGFEPELEKSDLKALGCKAPDDLDYLVIAVVPEDISKTTVNLKSPIVLNKKNNIGRQVILVNKDYPIRFPLAAEDSAPQPHNN